MGLDEGQGRTHTPGRLVAVCAPRGGGGAQEVHHGRQDGAPLFLAQIRRGLHRAGQGVAQELGARIFRIERAGGAVFEIGVAAEHGPARHAQEHDVAARLALQMEAETLVHQAHVPGLEPASPVGLTDGHGPVELQQEGDAGAGIVRAMGRRIADQHRSRNDRPKRAAAHRDGLDLAHRGVGRHRVDRQAGKAGCGGARPQAGPVRRLDAAQVEQGRNLGQKRRFHLRQVIALSCSRT